MYISGSLHGGGQALGGKGKVDCHAPQQTSPERQNNLLLAPARGPNGTCTFQAPGLRLGTLEEGGGGVTKREGRWGHYLLPP